MKRFLMMAAMAVAAYAQAPAPAAPAKGPAGPAKPAAAKGPAPSKPPAVPPKTWTKKLPWGDPDLSGVWQQDFRDARGRKVIGLDLADFVEIPYQPWSKEAYDVNKTPKGQVADPESACLPAGVPRSTGLPYPLRIMQTPDLISILLEGNVHSYRLIFMNKEHPKSVDPTWMGHSVGRWEGDTLVVDSVGFNDKTWLDPGGHVHSEQMHIVERFTRLNETGLLYEFTITDPGAYTKPWGWSYVLEGHPDWEIIEYVCNENNKDVEHMVQGNK